MFKVLIIDDENIIRRGLKNIIDWKSFECEICGEASDGIEGIEKIKQFHPDIIVTDIHMSGLDGLKMIKETKDIIPHCKIIILTGYRNFEYIKEALSLGAFDYILKPSKIDEITSILKRAVAKLKSDIKKDEEVKAIKSSFDDALPLLRQKLLYDIMFNINDPSDDIEKGLKLYNLNISIFLLIIVEIAEMADLDNGFTEKQTCEFGVINLFEDIFSEDFIVFNVPLNRRQVAFITLPNKNFKYIQKACEYSESLKENIKSCFNFDINIAISTLGTHALELSEKTREANEVLKYIQLMGKPSVMLFDEFKNLQKPIYFNKHDYFQKSITFAIRAGNETSLKNTLNEIYSYVDSSGLNILDVKNLYFNILKNIYYNILPGGQINDANSERKDTPKGIQLSESGQINNAYSEPSEKTIHESLSSCSDIGSLNILLAEFITDISSSAYTGSPKTINSTLQKAIEYINMNYSQPITLNKIADYTYVSSYYLSRLFTKHLGSNFVDYLNDIRIEKAKEYLKDSNYKTYEVAELVGINDAHYFSKLFKKYTGKTPSEYKNM